MNQRNMFYKRGLASLVITTGVWLSPSPLWATPITFSFGGIKDNIENTFPQPVNGVTLIIKNPQCVRGSGAIKFRTSTDGLNLEPVVGTRNGDCNTGSLSASQFDLSFDKPVQFLSYQSKAWDAGTYELVVNGTTVSSGNTVGTSTSATSSHAFASTPTLAAGTTATLKMVPLASPSRGGDGGKLKSITVDYQQSKSSQTISFGALGNKTYGDAALALAATASSNLAVSYTATGSCTISGQTVTLTGAGQCTVTASQAGNDLFSAATAVVQSFTIAKATQTLSFTPPKEATLGQSLPLTATVAPPGLSVTFASTTTNVCTVSGTTVQFKAAGTCQIKASQPGNDKYEAAPSVTATIMVYPETQTQTLPNQVIGDTVNLQANSTSGLPVTYSLAPTSQGCALQETTVTTVSVGTCVVILTQAGNATFYPARTEYRFDIVKGTQVITFTPPASANAGEKLMLTAIGGGSKNPVTFASSPTNICTVQENTVSFLATGTCAITANQAGNANYNAATEVSANIVVSTAPKTNQTITFGSLAAKVFGDADFNVSATATSNLPVTFSATGSCSLTSSTVKITGAGDCSIKASQAGDTTYNAATDVTQTFAISKANQIVTFAPALTGTAGQSTTLSATGGLSNSAIIFASSTPTICTLSGTTLSFAAVGTCTVTANQAGNANYNAATQISANIVVSTTPKTDQTISFNPALTGTVGTNATLSATATSGLTAITFASSPSTVCTMSGNSVSFVSAGNCIVTANQVGNDKFNAAKEVSATIVVSTTSKTDQTITFSPVLTGTVGQTANLTATASSGLTAITFASSPSTVCTINGNSVSFVSEGDCTITANQAGNEQFNAATVERVISSTVGVFDIRISYYDTYNNAMNRKNQIEDNIRHWADGVYESTNGAHRLGKVEIYTNAENINNADVVWIADCWPNASAGGRGKRGNRIEFCDTLGDSNILSLTRSGGYILAHEWGHFAYQLYDEYKDYADCDSSHLYVPCRTDVFVNNSIMDDNWVAIGANETLGDLKWLNFSTKLNNNGARISTNAQARVYKASAWETLARDPSLDPDNHDSRGRKFYKSLVAVAPATGQAPSIEIGTYNATTKTYQINATAQAKARERLSFVWKGNSGTRASTRDAASGVAKKPTVKIIAIENSANIHPYQLATVKVAANQLIRKAEIGDVIAVAAFGSDAQIVSALTLVSSEEDKKNLIQAVNSIQPSTLPPKLGTVVQRISDMVQEATASHPVNQYEKDIYLFAQGFTNNNGESIGLGDMIAKANDSNIRVFSFALNETTEKTLRVLSEMTHGESWFTPTLESLRDALSNLLDTASPMLDVIVAAEQATFTSNKDFPFSVDSTLGELSISVYYSGSSDGVTLNLVSPDGTMRTLTTNECASDTEIEGKNSCLVRVSRPVAGNWKLQATTTSSSGVTVSFDAHALPIDNKKVFFASANALPKITTPNQPVIVEATISGNGVSSYGETQLPIANLTVSGIVKKPDGTLETLTLYDDGSGDDRRANDGVYTASLKGEASGEYLVTVKLDNQLGTGQLTSASVSFAPDPDGNTPGNILIPVTSQFERVVQTQVLVKPILEDYQRVMNWGEAMFAQLNNQLLLVGFDKQEMDIPPYKVRFYPSSNTYLGFNPNDGQMYIYNPVIFGPDIISVGEMTTFLVEAQKAEF